MDAFLITGSVGKGKALPGQPLPPPPTPSIDSQTWNTLEEAGKVHPQGISLFSSSMPLTGHPQDQEAEREQGGLSYYYFLSVSKKSGWPCDIVWCVKYERKRCATSGQRFSELACSTNLQRPKIFSQAPKR
uniref:uncharacterized protein LOC128931823 isoform X2 n=1 Tax=Callithrix jacchus TaxID=9483 RepID=UPI0023DCF93C|nr:uncharacterized protein LOC128931823 isoform X2 [Callithrix jacchus]